ncbi:hypothetical protein TNCV_1736651 [Trichonephila clavipes]|nr:hypothetical protein TNCV_1736651 [Trichonephila clavipes]
MELVSVVPAYFLKEPTNRVGRKTMMTMWNSVMLYPPYGIQGIPVKFAWSHVCVYSRDVRAWEMFPSPSAAPKGVKDKVPESADQCFSNCGTRTAAGMGNGGKRLMRICAALLLPVPNSTFS